MHQSMHLGSAVVLTQGTNFRVHGNGFIQIDMPNGMRVHIWGHPEIPRQMTATQIHDHKFGFKSLVQYGTLVNVTYTQRRSTEAGNRIDKDRFKSDVYVARPRDREDTELVYDETIVIQTREIEVWRTGQMYAMSPYVFHETFVNCPTITVMRKTEVDNSHVPRVLCPIGIKPDNDFNRYNATDEGRLRRITQEVFEYWGDYSYRALHSAQMQAAAK